MAEPKRFGATDSLMLMLVLLLALGLRAGWLMTVADGGNNDGPLRVQDASPLLDLPPDKPLRGKSPPSEMDALIHNMKEHQWFGDLAPFAPEEEATAHVSPGYPWLAGLLARLLGDNADRAIRWIQCVLGALTACLYFLFCHRAFRSSAVAALAGLACAVYPFWIINTATLDDGVLASFLLALSLMLGTHSVATAGPFTSLLFGLTLAGLALVRAAMLPFAFVALAWFLLRTRSLQRGWLCALLAFLGFANGLAPWTVRNLQTFGEPVPIVDSAYLHLWIGNNLRATGGPLTASMIETAPVDELQKLKARDQPKRYARLGPEVLRELEHNPPATVQRRIWAGLSFWLGERFLTDRRLADETPGAEMPSWLTQAFPMALLVALVLVLVLALLGWRWTFPWRREAMLSVLALLWVPLPYVLGHADALSGPRLPLDGVLICHGAFALACLLPSVGRALLAGPTAQETEQSQ
jgi:4-amino-4-deoxy-L-arabinose transferase-like glycosyltransferase